VPSPSFSSSANLPRSEKTKKHPDPELVTGLGLAYQLVVREFAKRSKVRDSQLQLLRILGGQAEVSQSDIAEKLGADPASVTRGLQELERDGLVSRRAAPYDKRVTLVRLSVKGRRAADEQRKNLSQFEEELLAGLSKEQIEGGVAGVFEPGPVLEKHEIQIGGIGHGPDLVSEGRDEE
jgi:DNA-binding MarR family transcriptional regulator